MVFVLKFELFKNPPREFRGVPFWSINDKLRREELTRQIDRLIKAGYGGAFFHAREGLVTPYLSREWFDMFREAVKWSAKRGFDVWIYDELWWPSGYAGGIIPLEDRENRAKALILLIDTRPYFGEDVVASFKLLLDNNGFPISYERIKDYSDEEAIYLTFMMYYSSLGDAWFNGTCYVDLLNKNIVSKFIKVTLEPYVKYLREYIGKNIPGVFTDEPNYSQGRPRSFNFKPPRGARIPIYSIPWTNDLPHIFKRDNGYELLDRLPELFFDIGEFRKTRFDYWRTILTLFVESFTKQMFEWCEENNLQFTGHFLEEDSLVRQIRHIGSAMPHYEYMHIPGIDHLGLQIWNTFLTAKQVVSIANQLGKKRVMCETYGCLGNYGTFLDRKWIADYLLALGINLFVHHLVPYSLRGRRKRDYGLNFHWSQPWWRLNNYIEDYIARLSYILSQGKRITNILVISPMSSIWSTYSPIKPSKAIEIDRAFIKFIRSLSRSHVEFDLCDEVILSKYGRVGERCLNVGEMKYDLVILPYSSCIFNSTYNILLEYVRKGGSLIVFSQRPKYIDGKKSSKLQILLDNAIFTNDFDEAVKMCNNYNFIKIKGDNEGNLLYHLRRSHDSLILFIVNTSRKRNIDATLSLRDSYTVEAWDPFSGMRRNYDKVYHENEVTFVKLNLNPVQSILLVLHSSQHTCERENESSSYALRDVIDLSSLWRMHLLDNNILVLDYCSLDNKEYEPTWLIRDKLGEKGFGSRYELYYKFVIRNKPKGKVYLLLEKGPREVFVNGEKVKLTKAEWPDFNYMMADITDYVMKGPNIVKASYIVGWENEIEPFYILGRFSVVFNKDGMPYIDILKEDVEFINTVSCGLPFYCGIIEFHKSFNLNPKKYGKILLELYDINASVLEIRLNDSLEQVYIDNDIKVDITQYVREKDNRLKIRIYTTLNNFFGPLHSKIDYTWVGPESFEDRVNWTDKYMPKTYGIGKILIKCYDVVS